MLFIAASILSDRNGKKYAERIFPDVEIEENANEKTDITVDQAKKWLLSMTLCKQ